ALVPPLLFAGISVFGVAMLVSSALISGLGLGSLYGLLALGFHITHAVSNTVNFAQGSAMMLGAVLCFTFWVTFHWPHTRGDHGACTLRGLGHDRRAHRRSPLCPAWLERLVDGNRRTWHRARKRGPVHVRQGSARHASRLTHDQFRCGRRHQDPALAALDPG